MPKLKNTGQEEPRWEPLPPGQYKIKIQEYAEVLQGGTGKTAGAEVVKVTIVFPDHPGVRIFDRITFVEKLVWKVKQFAAAFDIPEPEIGGDFDINEDNTVGKIGFAEVDVVEYLGADGKKRVKNQIKRYLRPLDAAVEKPKPAPAVKLDVEGDDVPF